LIAAREFGAIAYLRQRLSLVRPLDARRFVAVVGWATLIAGAIALGDEVVEIVELAVGGSGAGVHPLPEHMGLPLLVGKLHGVFVGPVVEELVYRFVLLNGLRSALSFPWAAAITSVLFALAHAPNGWPDFAAFWWSGMIFAWGYRASGSIMSAIAGHALCNARAFFF
jgi:membrane protease YdiL (CAAX protease family)